jgi:hypothetical protein
MTDRRVSASRAALIAEVVRLWNEIPRIPTAEIGARLGITKNMVSGIIDRAGAPRRDNPAKPRTRTIKPSRPHPNARTRVSLPPLPLVRAAPVKPPAPKICVSRTCAYPLWPDRDPPPQPPRFCDAPVYVRHADAGPQTTAWCPTHYGRVFVGRNVNVGA